MSACTCEGAGTPNRVAKAASGVKMFLRDRLGRLKQILTRNRPCEEEQTAYLVETDGKHPDKWECLDQESGTKWVRNHSMPRLSFFGPKGVSNGQVFG